MGLDTKIYKKQNSFSEIHHRDELQDVLPRIKKLDRGLEEINLTSYQKKILKIAIGEIFGRIKPLDNASPFVLHSFNMAEIQKLSDELF